MGEQPALGEQPAATTRQHPAPSSSTPAPSSVQAPAAGGAGRASDEDGALSRQERRRRHGERLVEPLWQEEGKGRAHRRVEAAAAAEEEEEEEDEGTSAGEGACSPPSSPRTPPPPPASQQQQRQEGEETDAETETESPPRAHPHPHTDQHHPNSTPSPSSPTKKKPKRFPSPSPPNNNVLSLLSDACRQAAPAPGEHVALRCGDGPPLVCARSAGALRAPAGCALAERTMERARAASAEAENGVAGEQHQHQQQGQQQHRSSSLGEEEEEDEDEDGGAHQHQHHQASSPPTHTKNISSSSSPNKLLHRALPGEHALEAAAWGASALCACLPLDGVLSVLCAALLEAQVLFVCPALGTLTACVMAVPALVRPLEWQSVLLPVLPAAMVSFLEAPVPFVVGVQYKTDAVREASRECVRVNCYKSKVFMGGLSHIRLPCQAQLAETLAPFHAALAEGAGAGAGGRLGVTAARAEAALAVVAKVNRYVEAVLCGDLHQHAITDVSQGEKVSLLLKDSFCDSFERGADRAFARLFAETQMFSAYADLALSSLGGG